MQCDAEVSKRYLKVRQIRTTTTYNSQQLWSALQTLYTPCLILCTMEIRSPEQTVYSGESPCLRARFLCDRVDAGSSKSLLEYKSAPALKMSTISKAGIGIIKMATSQWRRQEKTARVVRSSSTGKRHSSSERFTCKKSLMDQIKAMLHGQTISKTCPDKLFRAKSRNCRRVVVLGSPKVGKTSILQRFLRDSFEERYEPTSEDFHRKLYQIRGETYQVDILDASGERDFPAKRRLSILTGDVFLLVFSVDDRNSFEEVRKLHKEILSAKSKILHSKSKPRIPTVICANKVDLEPETGVVCWWEAQHAFGEDCALFETSAKTGTNLEEAFEALAKRGGLPTETRPSQHRKISIRSYQALRAGRNTLIAVRTPGIDAPYGSLHPLVRRPSFSSDLRQVLGNKRGKPQGKFHIRMDGTETKAQTSRHRAIRGLITGLGT
ncbi:GTP-binding protein Rhes-like isoform X2 [Paramormyrops kingsleyae]|uniref:GTP-binding protein Rhes-like isoform X2 n=1 Tax=Paramormyrops kingsleyae TaxID=1676925 RepID=UPI003B9797BA